MNQFGGPDPQPMARHRGHAGIYRCKRPSASTTCVSPCVSNRQWRQAPDRASALRVGRPPGTVRRQPQSQQPSLVDPPLSSAECMPLRRAGSRRSRGSSHPPPPPSPDERLTRAPPPPVLLGVCPPDPAQNGIIDRILTRTSASPRRNPPAERSISLRSFQPIVGLVSVSARLLGLAPCLRPPASRLSHYHDLTDRLPTGEREC